MQRFDVALKAAQLAGKIQLSYFKRRDKKVQQKTSIRDLVTIADTESEKAIINLIRRYFPDDQIISEETGYLKGGNEYQWVVDPLDGTAHFIRGLSDFGPLISLMYKGKIIFGITFFPITNQLFTARRDKGAYKNGKKILVSSQAEIPRMFPNTQMCSKLPFRKKNFRVYKKVLFATAFTHVSPACIASLLTNVAEGLADFHFREGMTLWDYAAGVILIEEAGGKVTDFNGKPFGPDVKNVLASNGKNHNELVSLIKK